MRTVYSVLQINKYILNMFKNDYMLNDVCVQGEISNCKYHSTGIYFSLKDEESVISCVMFKRAQAGLKVRLSDGMKVIVSGSIESFVRDGKYQIYVKSVEEKGLGDLTRQYEELRRKLQKEGLFDPELKRPLPEYPAKIGIVTAPTGAAVRDIISISRRRNPYIQLILFPSLVQGENAKENIVKGIQTLEKYGVDLIIVGRGGGSIEDLWAFNEEIVAQAIFNCDVPVISAVGHETDYTIADEVADRRAPTPSAAAEIAVPLYSDIENKFAGYYEKLNRLMERRINDEYQRINLYSSKLENKSPVNRIKEYKQEVSLLDNRLKQAIDSVLTRDKHRLDMYIAKLNAASPLNRLSSGMAFVSDTEGKRIDSVEGTKVGDDVKLTFKDGSAKAKIVEVTKNGD